MATNRLPWQGILDAKGGDERENAVGYMKKKLSLEALCYGLPNEFLLFITYVKTLDFTSHPDYSYLRKLMRNLASRYPNDTEWNYPVENIPTIPLDLIDSTSGANNLNEACPSPINNISIETKKLNAKKPLPNNNPKEKEYDFKYL